MMLALILGLCGFARAQPQDAIVKCQAIVESPARLSCYDKLSSAPEPQPPSKARWHVTDAISDLDRSRKVQIQLEAERANVGRMGQARAALVIVCEERHTKLVVGYNYHVSFGGNHTTVQYRVGAHSPVAAKWSPSQDSKSYGLWETRESVPLIKAMVNADDFFVRGEAEHSGTSEALFKLEGIAEAIKPVREACKW